MDTWFARVLFWAHVPFINIIKYYKFGLFIFHHVLHFPYVLFSDSQLEEAVVIKFEVVEDLDEIWWEDGLLKPYEYIGCCHFGIWEKAFNTIIKGTNSLY